MKKNSLFIMLIRFSVYYVFDVGCESLTGPEGKYVHRDGSRMDVYALVFERKKLLFIILVKSLVHFLTNIKR